MSCTQQFDEMVKCYGVGGQLRHVYRYGTIRDCNDRWKMFKFCIGTRLDPIDVRKKRIQQFYKDKLSKQLEGGSSEDIWSIRNERHPGLSNGTSSLADPTTKPE
ncbi:hypothetical protein V1511DRAFT_358321 [Dipodascopsis uninucleata]